MAMNGLRGGPASEGPGQVGAGSQRLHNYTSNVTCENIIVYINMSNIINASMGRVFSPF